MKKRALLSVYDKRGIVAFAKALVALDYQVISTGGTLALLQREGVVATSVTDVTGFAECLDGRVKTLHPVVHGGILAMRDNPAHMATLNERQIAPIDVVVINLYPFRQTVSQPDCTWQEAIENIDIGGPTMLRAAAKNHGDVVVAVDPDDYQSIIDDLNNDTLSMSRRRLLALKVFEHTAHYDAMISQYLRANCTEAPVYPTRLTMAYDLVQPLRYGENPHQNGALYRSALPTTSGLNQAIQLHGKQLSFNNLNDAQAALQMIREFDQPTCVAVKHANPCGVGTANHLVAAFDKAYQADPVSIFGGVLAFNQTVDQAVAKAINKLFIEIVIAPDYTDDALDILKQKKNIRLLKQSLEKVISGADIKCLDDGIIIQQSDNELYDQLKVVTSNVPTETQMTDLLFALKLVKYVKSNGIVIAKNQQSIGIGPGQVSRIWAAENAIRQAGDKTRGAVLASDAFFPFDDVVSAAAQAGITAIIQPGGSKNDQQSIDMANAHGIAMVFAGMRHFKH